MIDVFTYLFFFGGGGRLVVATGQGQKRKEKEISLTKKGFRGGGRCLGVWESYYSAATSSNRPTEGAGENEFLRSGADAGGGVSFYTRLCARVICVYFTIEVSHR